MQKPFLKWAGNKFKILPLLIEHLGPHERLVEPFMGSGVFSLNTTKKYLGADLNSDLISIFDCLKDNPDNFIEYAKSFFTMEYVGEKSFYELRERFNKSINQIEKAAIFIYLNKYGFNGLCRYNNFGTFTTPWNQNSTRVATFPEEELIAASKIFEKSEIKCQSFEKTFEEVKDNDVVYCDPPYLPLDNKSGTFTSYSTNNFSIDEHKKIIDYSTGCRERNIQVLISNHDSQLCRELYKDADKILELDVHRSMGRYNEMKKTAKEILVIYGNKETVKKKSIIKF